VAGSCEHSNEPLGSVTFWKLLSNWATGVFSRKTHLHGVIYFIHSQFVLSSRCAMKFHTQIKQQVKLQFLLVLSFSIISSLDGFGVYVTSSILQSVLILPS
jgi:Ni,Fe-hydrogenase I cytochrome b subunit